MTDIPQFEVPEIIVDDEGQRQPSHQADADISPLLSATHIPGHHSSFNEVFGFDGNYPYSETLSATSSPARSPRHAPHQPSNSGHGLDPLELGSPSHSRQGSTVSAENVLEVFTESAWGESLRRSFTMRRPQGDA
jgi:voltage-dependent calcium channel